MKTSKYRFVSILLFFIFINPVFSQVEENTDVVKNTEKSFISASLNYISDAVFMGRKDDVENPYLYPTLTYYNKSGLYAKGSFSYLTKSNESRIDLFLFTAGIDFTIDKFSGDISATKYFFNDDSYNVISQVEADLSAIIRYDFNIINLSLGVNTYFSSNSNTDFFLSSEISHDFISSNNKFQISPTVGIYLGSQNFYEEYHITRQIKINEGGSGSGTGTGTGGSGSGTGDTRDTTQTVTETFIDESEKFDVMAIEFSVPMWYVEKSCTFSFLPTLVFPQSEANIIVDDVVTKEDLKETFYWVVGFSYKFN